MTQSNAKGFAAMTPAERRKLASKGGRKAHATGHAHEWTSEEATLAGQKGGRSKTRADSGKANPKGIEPSSSRATDGAGVSAGTDNASKDTPLTSSEHNGVSGATDVETERARQAADVGGGRSALTGQGTGPSSGSASSDGALYESEPNDDTQCEYKDRDRFS